MTIQTIRFSTLISGVVLAASVVLGAQGPMPVIADGEASDTVWHAINFVVGGAVDGIEHVAHFTKKLFVHGGKETSLPTASAVSVGAKK